MNRRLVAESCEALQQVITAIAAWLVGFPLTFFINRDSNLTIVIGRKGPVFADNSKYFFIAANESVRPGERIVFLTNNPSIQKAINDAGAEAVLYPSIRAMALLMRCSKLVMDMSEWFELGAYQLSRGTKLIQIWHGAPLKRIELDLYRERLANMPILSRSLLKLQKLLIGRYPRYDSIVSTSKAFIESAFSRCFDAKEFMPVGYPRNDILLGWPSSNAISQKLLNINVDNIVLSTVKQAHSNKQWVCLYVPTFRNDMSDPFSGLMDLSRLSEFAVRENLCVVLKLHPFMKGLYSINHYSNLLEYDALSDVYPLMPECDILITDYSSIYFDFLLLDRPIIFYAPDLESYIAEDRGMYFDYDSMTPGAKCHDFEQLEYQLTSIIDNNGIDGYTEQRAQVRTYTHDFTDNHSGHRLIDIIKNSKN